MVLKCSLKQNVPVIDDGDVFTIKSTDLRSKFKFYYDMRK